MRCVACDSPITINKRKKPITTLSGEMNSVFTDSIESFPFNEHEDLCSKCVSTVKSYNADQNNQIDYQNEFALRAAVEKSKSVIPETMGTEFLNIQADYDGYGTIEDYEDRLSHAEQYGERLIQ